MFRNFISIAVKSSFKSLTNVSNAKCSVSVFNKPQNREFCLSSALKALTLNTEYTPFQLNKSSSNRKAWEEERFLLRLHESGPRKPRVRRHPLDHKPQMKGVVLKTLIRKPKKPNSANRKCVLLRLSNGKEATAFVPGEGHNLQEHSVVLVQKKRVRDVPGLKLRVIRGAYDCAHVTKNK